MEDKKLIEWEKNNYPWKIINGKKMVAVNKTYNITKTIFAFCLILILIGFLALFGIRTYYYEFYNDVLTSTNLCAPNISIDAFECGAVNNELNCNCMNASDMALILRNICPDSINIHINSS